MVPGPFLFFLCVPIVSIKIVADFVAKAERERKTLATKSLCPCQIKDHTKGCGLLFGYVLANGKKMQ